MKDNKTVVGQSISTIRTNPLAKQGIMNEFASIQIGIASPETIRSWSFGEVKRAETINYRTQKPEKDGLFCERIFGPTKDWECHCGKYKRVRHKGVVCDKCGVKVTKRKVRRERMGHIELAAPVSHIWYFRGVPSRMGLMLDLPPKELEQLINFQEYIVSKAPTTFPTALQRGKKLYVEDYEEYVKIIADKTFHAVTTLDGLATLIKVWHEQNGRQDKGAMEEFAQELQQATSGAEHDFATKLLNEALSEEFTAGVTLFQALEKIANEQQDSTVGLFVQPLELSNEKSETETEDLLTITARILGERKNVLKDVILGERCVVDVELERIPLQYKQFLSVQEYRAFCKIYSEDKNAFKAGMGAETVRELLQEIDLEKESAYLRAQLDKKQGQQRIRIIKRYDIIESFRRSGNRPEWMVLTVLPVLPPDLRPMVPLDGGRYATSDLNDLYRRVINRNNRLRKMMEMNAPESLINNEKRMLQDAVDSLIDNSRSKRPQSGAGNRELKSLTGMLKGKQGRFRQNLLGKRVDYSGRSVIVVGPELKLHQCGIPKEMALELFKPFVMKKLVATNQCHNLKSAKKRVERADSKVWDILEEVIKDHPVLLNRAPTLHRLSIQAFEPVLIEGRAIKLHPLVCPAFNADFDGDQMPVHVPLSTEAQAEARYLMLAANNILKLSDGKPIIYPTQDMILGCYYLTSVKDELAHLPEEERLLQYNRYSSFDEAYLAYVNGYITLQTLILVRVNRNGENKMILTTVGRGLFCQAIPMGLGIDEELSFEMIAKKKHLCGTKKELSSIVERCFKKYDTTRTAKMLDDIKALGYKYSTISGLTTSVFDMHVPAEKKSIISKANKEIDEIETAYEEGFITENERYRQVIKVWREVNDKIVEKVKISFEDTNPIKMMSDSGARGNIGQLVQLCGMRGLMNDTTGKTIELPVKACFREGLSVLEYFISSHGGRKGLADTAIKTADSGYLTRRLVDVAHNVIISEEDCSKGSKPQGMWVSAFTGNAKDSVIENFEDRIVGKFYIDRYKIGEVEKQGDIIDETTGEVLCPVGEFITDDVVEKIKKIGVDSLYIRSVLTCKSEHGVCAKCYGKNMATGKPVHLGEAVGVIAAQSIGEPGTQLTMRTFHSGGVASADDITQGLPRVEELFEARKPKGCAVLCENNGIAQIKESGSKKSIIVTDEEGKSKEYPISYTSRIRVADGQRVESGMPLTEGALYPQDLLKTKGVHAVEEYLLKEVQSTYRGSNKVDIDDKHIEIIIRQMLRKVRIEDAGDTNLLPGELVDINVFEDENLKALENDQRPATAKRSLLGITKAALATDSFLSASSFQETPRVLTEAAIKNKRDYLFGLKENVIIGKLIPAGTGIKTYRDAEVVLVSKTVEKEKLFTDDDDQF